MRAIQVSEHGGPDQLMAADVEGPIAGPGQVLVEVEAIGVNYIDTYHRSGLYPVGLPFIPGLEAAGTVVAVGDDVDSVAPGQRVASCQAMGSYAERVAAPADKVVVLPDAVDGRMGAAVMLQGMTAHYLSHDTYRLGPQSVCLIHAGAGGVGLLLIQMAKRLGATVFTTVSTEEKAGLAQAAGADHVIRYTEVDFAEAIKDELGFRKLDVVYDGVGQATFSAGLNLLRRRGLMVLFGQSSGPVPPLNLGELAGKGSLYVTRPTMGDYLMTRQQLEKRANDLFTWIEDGSLDVRVGQTFGLDEAAAAHRALEGRETTGKILLLP